jgi:pimeloyl-ACP methyl ester carboxylesterase
MDEPLQLRVHAAAGGPHVVYLPGLHGDWTLVGRFRAALAGRATFAEFTYPRTLTWSLPDYARSVAETLVSQESNHGWLLAESFGSQVAWAMLAEPGLPFRVEGVVFAGGFVRYGQRWLVRLGERVFLRISARSLQQPLRAYARAVRLLRYRTATGQADLEEFAARRTELDKNAAAHRLRLIAAADWRPVAARAAVPVFHLAGLFDPIVPWWPQQRWLRRHCPSFCGARVIAASDHNVLGSAPRVAADQVLAWIAASAGL